MRFAVQSQVLRGVKMATISIPKITIVTPSYNCGKFIKQTIESILAQDSSSFEYIVVDGSSSDGSVEIIRQYSKYLAWWDSSPDKGQSDAINKGFAHANGDWVAWVNADDVLFPEALRTVSEAAMGDPDVEIITGNVVYIDSYDRIIKCIRIPGINWSFFKHGVAAFAAPAIFFKKSLYNRVGGLDLSLHYSMDVELFHKFCQSNAKVVHINKYIGAFRFHSTSKTGMFRGSERTAFENPETTRIRAKYIPNVSKTTIRLVRVLQRVIRLVNLNIPLGWVDRLRWGNKTWQQVFK